MGIGVERWVRIYLLGTHSPFFFFFFPFVNVYKSLVAALFLFCFVLFPFLFFFPLSTSGRVTRRF